MTAYFVKALTVDRLWGHRSLRLQFYDDVNILIGPNASGKTTILNLLRAALAPDMRALLEIEFSTLKIHLQAFRDISKTTVQVRRLEDILEFQVAGEVYPIAIERDPRRILRRGTRIFDRTKAYPELVNLLQGLVPAVWLPVSRRLPISEHEEDEFLFGGVAPPSHRRRAMAGVLESVDERLRELLQELVHYRLRLDASLAEEYKNFEKQVLAMMLYNKDLDSEQGLLSMLRKTGRPKQEEKDLLLRSFAEAGLLDPKMRERIDEHFNVAEEILSRIERGRRGTLSNFELGLRELQVLPLIRRTRTMIQAARELEKAREVLFTPLRSYERSVSSFFQDKSASVPEDGQLQITTQSTKNRGLEPEKLSSGEKQLLILLTQALLKEDEPVVYVADEPELSLHVSWQERLLQSLLDLGGMIQIIVATHSPDIVDGFRDRVIDLGLLK